MKKLIITIIAIVVVLGVLFVIGNTADEKLGGLGGAEGDYVRLTTGEDGVVSAKPAILHRVIFGAATDEVVISNHTSDFTQNEVFHLDPSAAGVFELETIFPTGIITNVTASDGMVFVISPY